MITKFLQKHSKHLLVSVLSLLLAGNIQARPADLSDLQDSSQSALSADTLKEIISHTRKIVLLSPKVIQDPVVKDYIQRLGMTLVEHVENVQQPYTFFLVRQNDINAFATLGNYIGVHTGLLLATETESELAAVLAHEISHCQQQHLLHMIQHSQDMRLPMILGMVGALGLSVLNPNLGQGLLVAGAAGMQQDMINYTRSFEREADQVGINLLQKTHYAVDAMPTFFNRMQQQERYYDNPVTPLLRTHPVTTSRIAEAKNYAARMQQHPVKESVDYKFMRERLRVLHNKEMKQLNDYYRIEIKKQPNNDDLYYGAALVAGELGDYQGVISFINRMPHHKHYWLSELVMSNALSQSHPQQGLKIVKKLYAANPDSYPIIISYIEQLKHAKQAKQAVRIARLGLINRRKDPLMWWILSEAENKAGNKAQAYFAAAHAHDLLDKRARAITFLKQAKKIGKQDRDLQAQIKAKLLEWHEPSKKKT